MSLSDEESSEQQKDSAYSFGGTVCKGGEDREQDKFIFGVEDIRRPKD